MKKKKKVKKPMLISKRESKQASFEKKPARKGNPTNLKEDTQKAKE